MSGTVKCYFYENNDTSTRKCDLSAAVVGTDIIFGKNQPFLGIEVSVSKYMFDSLDFWSAQGFDTCPKPVQNFTRMYVTTYGGSYELLYTQTNNPDESTYVFMCYSKMYQMKTTNINSLLGKVTWNGATEAYRSGMLKVHYTIDGVKKEYSVDLKGLAHITHSKNMVYRNIQVIAPSKLTSFINLFGVPSERDINKTVSIGTLRVLIPIYTDETIPSIEGYSEPTGDATYQNTGEETTIINASAKTVYASVVFQYTVPVSEDDWLNWFKGMIATHVSTTVQEYDSSRGEMVESLSTTADGILNCLGVEYVCGYTQAVFAWMSNRIGGYSGSDLVIDRGFIYQTSDAILSDTTYTKEELRNKKESRVSEYIGDTLCKLKSESNCYDSLKALATMTNRYVYYADRPYMSSFDVNVPASTLEALRISYNASDSSYCAYFLPFNKTQITDAKQIPLGSGVSYNDQGSTYLVSRQKAASKSTSVTVNVSDVDSDVEGKPVELNINTESNSESQSVLAQVAFNTLMRNYSPKDTLSFIALENVNVNTDADFSAVMLDTPGLPIPSVDILGKLFVNTGADDVNLYECVTSGDGYDWQEVELFDGATCVVRTTYKTYNFRFDSSQNAWIEDIFISTVVRDALLRPDTRCKELYDERSNKTLENVPLSYVVLSWPDCATRYMFGEPAFQDTEEAISELQSVAAQAVTNTSISESLNSSYSSVAIGNLSSSDKSELTEDYTGILMQKNDATGVASIDGYSAGERQVRFSSEGSISCGTYKYRSRLSGNMVEAGDTVVMDASGFRTRSWHLYSSEAPEYSYADGFWRTECEISTDGSISAGAGSVEIGSEGIVTKDDTDNTVYALNENGLTYYGRQVIDTASGKINLHVDTAVIDGNLRAVSITLPYVQIDNYGLRTFSRYYYNTENETYQYYAGDLQCSVGTNGVITAGAGAVRLDSNGVTTYSGVLKADETGVYSYQNAVKECQMTTNGQFIAGNPMNGWSIMDSTGLKIYSKGEDPTTLGANRDPMVWVDTKGYHLDNSVNEEITGLEVNYGTWSNYVDRDGDIKANVNLLSNVHLNAGPVCYSTDIPYGVSINNTSFKEWEEPASGTSNIECYIIANNKQSNYYFVGRRLNINNLVSPPYFLNVTEVTVKLMNSSNEYVLGLNSGLRLIGDGMTVDMKGINMEIDATVKESILSMKLEFKVADGSIKTLYIINPHQYTVDPVSRINAQYYSVVLHPKGLTTYSYTGYDSTGRITSEFEQTKQCEINTKGEITAGAGAVKLDHEGLHTYHIDESTGESTEICRVDNTGTISANYGNITMNEEGFSTYAGNKIQTRLDIEGLKTYVDTSESSRVLRVIDRPSDHPIFSVNNTFISEDTNYMKGETISENSNLVDIVVPEDAVLPEGLSTSVLRLYKKEWSDGRVQRINAWTNEMNYQYTNVYCTFNGEGSGIYTNLGVFREASPLFQNINSNKIEYICGDVSLTNSYDMSTLHFLQVSPVGTPIPGTNLKLHIKMGRLGDLTTFTLHVNDGEGSSIIVENAKSIPSYDPVSGGYDFVYDLPDNAVIGTMEMSITGSGFYEGGTYRGAGVRIDGMYISYVAPPGGSEVRIWDNNISLCGQTKIYGTLDIQPDVYMSSNSLTLLTKTWLDICGHSISANNSSGYVTIPAEKSTNGAVSKYVVIQWMIVNTNGDAVSSLANWPKYFKDANYAVTLSLLNTTSPPEFNNVGAGSLWVYYKDRTGIQIANDLWGGPVMCIGVGVAYSI